MDMFKLYGCTKEEVYDMLEYFNIYFNIQNIDALALAMKLSSVIDDIEAEIIESEYSIDVIEHIMLVLEDIAINGYDLEVDFIK